MKNARSLTDEEPQQPKPARRALRGRELDRLQRPSLLDRPQLVLLDHSPDWQQRAEGRGDACGVPCVLVGRGDFEDDHLGTGAAT